MNKINALRLLITMILTNRSSFWALKPIIFVFKKMLDPFLFQFFRWKCSCWVSNFVSRNEELELPNWHQVEDDDKNQISFKYLKFFIKIEVEPFFLTVTVSNEK